MKNVAIFVINLDRSPERLKTTTALLEAQSLAFERVAGVEGKDSDPTLAQGSRTVMGRDLTSGEVGCFLSHRKAAMQFLETDAELGVVLEDDVAVTSDSRACIASLSARWTTFPIFDVVNLGRAAKPNRTPVRAAVWDGPLPLYHSHYMPVTTTALMWTRGGAQSFLMMSQRILYPVDVQIQRWVAKTDRGLAFAPAPFASRTDASTIDGRKTIKNGPLSIESRKRIARVTQTHIWAWRNRLVARGRLK